jgi:hypothetical protein
VCAFANTLIICRINAGLLIGFHAPPLNKLVFIFSVCAHKSRGRAKERHRNIYNTHHYIANFLPAPAAQFDLLRWRVTRNKELGQCCMLYKWYWNKKKKGACYLQRPVGVNNPLLSLVTKNYKIFWPSHICNFWCNMVEI